MSFGQGFPLPFSRFFSLRILFCLPSIQPRRQYHHQEKEQRSVIFPSIHASNSWNSLFDKRLSVKFPEKHVKNGSFIFFYFFWGVCGVVYGPGIRLDCFFFRKVCNIYVFFGTTQVKLASWHLPFYLGCVCLDFFLFEAQFFFSNQNHGDLHVILPLGNPGIRQGWWFGSEKLRWKEPPTNQPIQGWWLVVRKRHIENGFWKCRDTGVGGMQVFFWNTCHGFV